MTAACIAEACPGSCRAACGPPTFSSYQRAPLSVQDVEQVVVTPRSQAMQAPTHCFKSLGLYGL